MAAVLLLLLLLSLLMVVVAATSSSGGSEVAFLRVKPQPQQQQQRAARIRTHGRKKRTGGRSNTSSGGNGSTGDDGDCKASSSSGSRGNKTAPRPTTPTPVVLSSTSRSSGSGNVASLLSKSDKYGVLRTIEGLSEWELQGPTLVTAWDRLAQRTAAAGPRAPHLPPLHLDRAFSLLVERTWARLPQLAPGHCASVASSLAKLRYRPEDAFLSDMLASCQAQGGEPQSFGTAARLAAALARLDYGFEGADLAALAWAMRERMVAAQQQGTDGMMESLAPESLATGMWALAVLGALQGGNGNDDLRERLLAASIARLRAAHAAALLPPTTHDGSSHLQMAEGRAKNLVRICRQLRTALLFLLPAAGSSSSDSGNEACVPSAQEELGAVIDEVWADLDAWLDPVHRSRLQLEVEGALLTGGGRPAGEWGDGVVTVDIALHPRVDDEAMRPVALEVDGPSHFFLNQPQRPTGDTKIKHQALHVGYPQQWAAVISIPHFEWPRIQKHRLDLLRRKLAQAGLEPTHFLEERMGKGSGTGKPKK